MKDFKEFEELLDSDECVAEWKEIQDRIADDLAKTGEDVHMFSSFAAMRRAHFELRKYHEWLNG